MGMLKESCYVRLTNLSELDMTGFQRSVFVGSLSYV